MSKSAAPEEAGPAPAQEAAEPPTAPPHQAVHANFRERVVFNGPAYFGSAGAGASDGPGSATPLTGPVPAADVEKAAHRYVAPDAFDEALGVLRREHLVVLHGDPGVGKAAGALNLLGAVVKGQPIVAMSPAYKLGEIARLPFRKGGLYVIQDWLGDDAAAEASSFAVSRLRAELRAKQAYLVLTTSRRPGRDSFRGVLAHWDPPDPQRVLDAYLSGVELDDSILAQIEDRFSNCRSPRDIAEFATRLAKAKDPARTASSLLTDQDRDEVRGCFDGKQSPEWISAVTGLAFAHGLPVQTFEQVHSSLHRRLVPKRRPGKADDKEPFIPEGRQLLRDHQLVEFRRVGTRSGSLTEVVGLISESHRQHVLEELWARYDRRLWGPTLAWLDELALSGDEDVLFSVADGVATFWKASPFDVEASVLEPWAASDDLRQVAACYVIWLLAFNEDSAPAALDMATRWAQSKGDTRKRTAMMALSGSLGARFPADAFRWLWHLTHQERLHDEGVLALAELALTCADNEPVDLSGFRKLQNQLRRVLKKELSVTAVTTVVEVMDRAVNATIDGEPALARLLIRKPEAAQLIAPLWAENLVTRGDHMRGSALRALAKLLRYLHRLEHADVIAALGRAVLAVLPEHEVAALKRDLMSDLRGNTERGAEIAQAIVDVMLTPQAKAAIAHPQPPGNPS